MADGITNVVYNVTKELAKRGHEVAVYTSDMLDLRGRNTLCPGHSIINGVNVYHLRSVWHSKTLIATPGLLPLLSKSIDKYDVIHIHDCRSFQGISTYLFSRMKNVPFVFQPHGSYLSPLPEFPLKTLAKLALDKLFSDKIMRNASKVVALSQVEAKQYERIGIPAERIVVIPNGIVSSNYDDLPPKGYFREKYNIPKNRKVLLYLGRIHKTKGIDLLIKSFIYLTRNFKCTDCMLIVVGPDDGYLTEAESLLASHGVYDSVLFTGFLDEKDKLGALVDASLFVTPAFHGFPLTFLEACIVGTPIITTTMGDTLDWIDGNVGYVVSPTHYDLAKAACFLLSNTGIATKFSMNGREIARSLFSIEQVVDRIEEVYSEVASIL